MLEIMHGSFGKLARTLALRQVLFNTWATGLSLKLKTCVGCFPRTLFRMTVQYGVDVHIRRLRKALEPFGKQHLIQTVRGAGYRFSARL